DWLSHHAWLTARVSELLDLGGVFDRIALGVFVIREKVVAKKVASWSPRAPDTALASVEDSLEPLLPIPQFESRVIERGNTVSGGYEGNGVVIGVARPEAHAANESVGKLEA